MKYIKKIPYQIYLSLVFGLSSFFPNLAFAQINSDCSGNLANLSSIFQVLLCFINVYIVPLLFAVAIVFFLYGVVKFIQNAANETERAKGREFMIWSIVALFVMISVWGLVGILSDTFSLDNQRPNIPQFEVGQ